MNRCVRDFSLSAPSAQKDTTAHSALSFATGPNRRISRQREAPAVRLDASVCGKTQRVRDPRPTTHKSALKAVVFCPPAIARPYTSRPWSRRPARSRAISPATSLLISSYLNTISRDRWRVNRRTSRRSRPASRADVAALCRKPWGRMSRGKPTALPNRRTIRRTDSPESRTSGSSGRPSRRWKSGPGSLPRASVHSTRAAAMVVPLPIVLHLSLGYGCLKKIIC